jgi:hypothetical protein
MTSTGADFVVDPDAARAAARACRRLADELAALVDTVRSTDPGDFGACHIGQALRHRFAGKLGNVDSSLRRPIAKAERDLRELSAQFDDAAGTYEGTDDEARRQVTAVGDER